VPTVHLSLPSKVYSELKEKAAEYGIQVTDLIKIYIKRGLSQGLVDAREEGDEYVTRKEFEALAARVEELEKMLSRYLITLRTVEGRVHELSEEMEYVYSELERVYDEAIAKVFNKALGEAPEGS